ncbi:MAG: ABC transporter substrate-binding protein [Gemmatimonadota bacterium]|nr:ABC transporter substrate-binding protein [Gemmatimonadota bacterium]MDH4347227.1 ABC transporter substrate-binding protein [Gemmatimonadota bacterium]
MANPLMTARRRPRSGGRLLLALVAVALVAAVVWMALTIGNPVPPNIVVMATGPEGSGYQEFGLRYQEILRRAGVELRLRPTAGGVENLALLSDPASGVTVAFVESGVATREESPALVSLGAVAVEPLWGFFRGRPEGAFAGTLVGKRISIEPKGSGTALLARRLIELNRVADTSVELLGLTPEQSADALMRGEIDAAFMLTSWHSPAVRKLLAADGIVLGGYPRADAYVALFPSLSKVILPTGVADLAKNIPPVDVQLLAAESNLLVHRDLHPALQYLLLEAASEIHGGPDVFHPSGRFPAPGTINLPLSDQARTYYKSGRPFTYRYLPFWMAGLAEKLLILLIPLFAVVFPLASILPRLFAVVTERRIFGLYRELKLVERELELPGADAEVIRLEAELEELDHRANHLWVPLSYAQRLFILKSHILLARERVEKRRVAAVRPAP